MKKIRPITRLPPPPRKLLILGLAAAVALWALAACVVMLGRPFVTPATRSVPAGNEA